MPKKTKTRFGLLAALSVLSAGAVAGVVATDKTAEIPFVEAAGSATVAPLTGKGASTKHWVNPFTESGKSTKNYVTATFQADSATSGGMSGDFRAGVSIAGDEGFLAAYVYYKDGVASQIAFSASEGSETSVTDPWNKMTTIYNITKTDANPKGFVPASYDKYHTMSLYREGENVYLALDGSQILTGYTENSKTGLYKFSDLKAGSFLSTTTEMYPSLSVMSGQATFVDYSYAQGAAATTAWNSDHHVIQTGDTTYSAGNESGKDSRGSYNLRSKIAISSEESKGSIYLETEFKATALNETTNTGNFNFMGFYIKNTTVNKWLNIAFKVSGASTDMVADCAYISKTSSYWWNGTTWNDSTSLGKVTVNTYNKLAIYKSGTTLKLYINDQLSNNAALANFDLTNSMALGDTITANDAYEFNVDTSYVKSSRYRNVRVYAGAEADAAAEAIAFNKNYMHPEIAYTDGSDTGNCMTYYPAAKTAYNAMTQGAKDLFCTKGQFAYAKDRLTAWANANGDDLTTNGILGGMSISTLSQPIDTMAIISVSAIGVAAAVGCVALVRKKKAK
ncbi:MAG: hypothetical protein MJ239_02860 [Bacilli bacterium]|nr:hypothetical protein [Bacilli bacterium]